MNQVIVSPARHPRRRLALIIAIVADALQFAILPLLPFVLPSLVDDAIDVIVAIVLIWLLGWHLAFLPTFAAELVPGVDLLPTWTAAVWFVTRKKKTPPPVEPTVAGLP
jgi:hypothetical protein